MIDIEDVVRPGDRCDFETIPDKIAKDIEGEKKYYITKVYDVNDDGTVSLVMPLDKTKLVVLSEGEEYDLYFYAGKGIYACRGRVVGRLKDDNNIPVAVVETLTDLKKHQRREYYRYTCVVPMNTRQLPDWEEKDFIEHNRLDILAECKEKSVVVDISGGGIRFVSSEDYEPGKLVNCIFVLNIKGINKTHNHVMRILSVTPVPNNAGNKEYRGQFIYIENGDREEIISFIFEEERKIRAKMNGY